MLHAVTLIYVMPAKLQEKNALLKINHPVLTVAGFKRALEFSFTFKDAGIQQNESGLGVLSLSK